MNNAENMTTIADRLQAVKASIHAAEITGHRVTNSVTLLAVSKAQPASSIREAWLAGQRHFGENYLQEALTKQSLLTDIEVIWHFIGPIQSNKTQAIGQHFAWVHSVDRLKIADRLNQARPDHLPPLQICLQINVSNEISKSGVALEDAMALAKAISKLPKLKLRGLMAIPAPTDNVELQHQQFSVVEHLFESMRTQGYAVDTLSIGMSEDYKVAIQHGATIVRIGSAIFGARPKQGEERDAE